MLVIRRRCKQEGVISLHQRPSEGKDFGYKLQFPCHQIASCRGQAVQPIGPIVIIRVWVRIPVVTLVPLSQALSHNMLLRKKGHAFALPARLLQWMMPIPIHPPNHEWGNPVSSPCVQCERVLLKVVTCSPHFLLLGNLSIKRDNTK